MKQDELLKYAIENGMIDIQSLQENMNKVQYQKYLAMHSYKIWENKTTHLWYTYLPDSTKANGRVLKKRKTEKEIKDVVAEFYEKGEIESDKKKKEELITLRKLLPEWLEFKAVHTQSSSYVKRISSDWFRYYDKSYISDLPIISLDKPELDKWAHLMIKEHSLSKKQFYNMSIIIRQGLDYAVDRQLIEKNYFKDVVINRKMLKKDIKKSDETQVFLTNEQPRIEAEAYRDYNETGSVTALAIPLAFQTGMRIGELVAIKSTDIKGKYLHVQRMEVKEFEKR